MDKHNYPAIGRYYVAKDELTACLHERDSYLHRAGLIVGKKAENCRINFTAIKNLLQSAEECQEHATALMAEINELAPIAGTNLIFWINEKTERTTNES